MRRYIETRGGTAAPQFLQLAVDGQLYRLRWVHVTVDEKRCEVRTRRPRGHAHDLYHAVLFTRGAGHFTLHDREAPCQPGTLVLTGPLDSHDFGPTHPGLLEYRELTLAWEAEDGRALRSGWRDVVAWLTGVPVAALNIPPVRHLDLEPFEQVSRHIENVLNVLDARQPGAAFLGALELAALLRLVAAAAVADSAPAETGDSMSARLHRARLRIEQHYRARLAVPALAELAGLSEGHFHRRFRALFGIAPHAYQQRLRLDAARVLLRSSALSCKEIAAQVGYDDPALFSRLFHRRFGQAPGACRR
ncbi:MAG: hypothetical protein A3K19_20670 [Lentisphaerae bacterium RIFOXYB12_FULL_65_16]|nr:MAG: hypothetical protein A3K18_17630 [Lentisphaerae bacterium RIFOXYA12_64_32]OGV89412.1 MAG: hypothetical protein A3K19_20670 [Lentisphaerae bacterium RIFOXYB12_FULL_65_16]